MAGPAFTLRAPNLALSPHPLVLGANAGTFRNDSFGCGQTKYYSLARNGFWPEMTTNAMEQKCYCCCYCLDSFGLMSFTRSNVNILPQSQQHLPNLSLICTTMAEPAEKNPWNYNNNTHCWVFLRALPKYNSSSFQSVYLRYFGSLASDVCFLRLCLVARSLTLLLGLLFREYVPALSRLRMLFNLSGAMIIFTYIRQTVIIAAIC